jgi:hypothetical protein
MPQASTDETQVETSSLSTGLEDEASKQDANESSESSDTQSQSTEKPQTLLDVVKDQFKKSSSASESETEAEEKEETTEEKPSEESSEKPADTANAETDEKPVPYARFKEVNEEKNTLKQQVEANKAAVEDYQVIVNYLQDNNIPTERFGYWMKVAAAVENNSPDAQKLLEPYFTEWSSSRGDVLDADLQEAVDKGALSIEWAKKVMAGRGAEKAKARLDKSSQEQQAQRAAQQARNQLYTALSTWQQSKQQTDPDFKPKTDSKAPDGKYEIFLAKFSQAVQSHPISNAQDAVALSERVLQDVNTLFASFKPKPTQTKVLPKSTASTTKTTNQPSTLTDVVRATARKHGLGV